MNRPPARSVTRGLSAAVALSLVLAASAAHAAKPTTAECLAASESAIEFGKKHSLRDQRTQLLICSAASCPGDIRHECTHRVEEVSSAIPTITFEVKDDQGQDLSSVKLSMDGELLAERLDGTALSIDPGEHTFRFETPGRPPLEKHFVIREGQKDRRESIVFSSPQPAPSPPPPGRAPPLKAASEPSPGSDSTSQSGGLSTQKTLALVAAGVGVGGTLVGTIFGLKAKSKHDQAARLDCSGATCKDSDGVQASADAVKAGNVSTVAFIVGAAGLVGGAVLWVTAKSSDASRVQVGLGPGTLQVRTTW